MRPLPVTDVAAMKTYEPDDHVISIYTRISNRAEYGAPLPAPTVDVPASWEYPDDNPMPMRTPTRLRTLDRRRRAIARVIGGYVLSAVIWAAFGAVLAVKLL